MFNDRQAGDQLAMGNGCSLDCRLPLMSLIVSYVFCPFPYEVSWIRS